MIFPHGGFAQLRSFQVARRVYDGTVVFCHRYVDRRSRTHDQMVQAARSGVQNIAEGSLAAATSRRTEIKLTNVARASLGELRLDYEDFLRQRHLRLWDKDSPEAMQVRRAYQSDKSDESDSSEWSDFLDSSEVFANTVLCLIHQASYLLMRQIQHLEAQFRSEGGFSERLFQQRRQQRRA